ncbi:ComEC/Rec2 family competence protein [Granulicoccus phenolivorans]|uniref:ComEC/Rec2 family competence protein n=1 Tax=Granulicoccus phenolivorans TaxID=266854 RepID=UPI0003F9A9E2|nr:ComEC/Rec2 family competence protein [Granulicoccus phenolivorans]
MDLRLVPLAVAAWAGMWVATSGVPGAVLGVGAAALPVLLLARLRRSWLLAAVALTLAVSAAIGGLRSDLVTSSSLRHLAEDQAVVNLELTVLTDPQRRSGRFADSAVLTGEAREVSGRGMRDLVRQQVVVRGSGDYLDGVLDARVGTTLEVRGRLRVPDPGVPEAAILTLNGPVRTLAEPNAGLRLVERVRSGLRASVSEAAEEPRALLPALVLGDTSRMQPELTEDFRTTGLTHLTAVSGDTVANKDEC